MDDASPETNDARDDGGDARLRSQGLRRHLRLFWGTGQWLSGAAALGLVAISAVACSDEVNGLSPNLAAKLFVPRTFTLPLSHPLAYVSLTGTDALAVIDLTDMSLAARLPIGTDPIDKDGPGALAFDAARHLLYVALTEPTASTFGPHSASAISKTGFIAVVNANNLAVTALWPVGRSPASLALSADGDTLFVSHSDGVRAGSLSQDITTRRSTVGRFSSIAVALSAGRTPTWDVATVCVLPEGLALDEGRGLLGVACAGEDNVAFLDTASLAVTSRQSVMYEGNPAKPISLVFSRERAIWTAADRVARALAFFAADALPEPGDRTEVDGLPYRPFWSRAGNLLVPTTAPDEIDVLDGTTHEVLERHPFEGDACDTPGQIVDGPDVASPSGTSASTAQPSLLVLCLGDTSTPARLIELDPSTFAVRRSVGLATYANSVVVRQP